MGYPPIVLNVIAWKVLLFFLTPSIGTIWALSRSRALMLQLLVWIVIKNKEFGTSEGLGLIAKTVMRTYTKLLSSQNITLKQIVKSVIMKVGGQMSPLIIQKLNLILQVPIQIKDAGPAILRRIRRELRNRNLQACRKHAQIATVISIIINLRKTG